eukprot:4178091-Pyramimonas_sp.AAC.1
MGGQSFQLQHVYMCVHVCTYILPASAIWEPLGSLLEPSCSSVGSLWGPRGAQWGLFRFWVPC